jgi:hypothetical protein
MSVNKYHPHLFVLPEDDANRQFANGFLKEPSLRSRRIQVLAVAGGWTEVLETLITDHVEGMELYPARRMVLLIDFDGDKSWLQKAKDSIADALIARVFILGAWTKPEDLRQANLGTYEQIGMKLAADCRGGSDKTSEHELLKHNAGEVSRLRAAIAPFFGPPDWRDPCRYLPHRLRRSRWLAISRFEQHQLLNAGPK